MEVLEGHARREALDYCAAVLGVDRATLVGEMPYTACLFAHADGRNGVGILTNYRITSIEIALAGDPGWVRRRDIFAMCDYLFNKLGVNRVWGMISAENQTALNFASKMGARNLELLRDEFGQGRHANLFSLQKHECPWLKQAR